MTRSTNQALAGPQERFTDPLSDEIDVLEDEIGELYAVSASQRSFARWDIAHGAIAVAVGSASLAVGAFRWHANVALWMYGAALMWLGGLLIAAGRRR